ncbi:hypothetical protein DRP77_12080 [Candidatus Poribacteria bacterium]|nr:MAG: hypothetical protein DRP77_12080 [Candidatus Poribacteria bacterium]
MRSIGPFLALTFGINWLMAALFKLLGGRWGTPPALILGVGYMSVPAISAVIVQRAILREGIVKPLGISFKPRRWFLISWLIPPLLALGAVGIGTLMPGVELSTDASGYIERLKAFLPPDQLERAKRNVERLPVNPLLLGLLQGMIAGPTVNAAAAFGEELG